MEKFRHVKLFAIFAIQKLSTSNYCNSLKVKHFTPEFVGSETKEDFIDFRFIDIKENLMLFSGLTIECFEKKLNIYVAFRQKDGSTTEEAFEFSKNEW